MLRPRTLSGRALAPLQPVRSELLAQRRAIDAERGGGLALVAAGPVHDFAQQRAFDLVEHQRVQVAGLTVHVVQVAAHRARDALAQGRLQRGLGRFAQAQVRGGVHRVDTLFAFGSSLIRQSRIGFASRAAPKNLQRGSDSLSPPRPRVKYFFRGRVKSRYAAQRNLNSYATAFLPGSATSNTSAVDPCAASPEFSVRASPRYSVGLKRRIAMRCSSRSVSVISTVGNACATSASLRSVAEMISAFGTDGCGRTSRESRVRLSASRASGSAQCSTVQPCSSQVRTVGFCSNSRRSAQASCASSNGRSRAMPPFHTQPDEAGIARCARANSGVGGAWAETGRAALFVTTAGRMIGSASSGTVAPDSCSARSCTPTGRSSVNVRSASNTAVQCLQTTLPRAWARASGAIM